MLPIKVDKIVCKNLDRRTDRWKLCLWEFSKWGLKVERIVPIDDVFAYRSQCLTTLKILSDAIQSDLESILILEDDVEFIHLDCLIEPPSECSIYYLGFIYHPAPINSVVEKVGPWFKLLRHCHASHAIVFYRNILSEAVEVLERRLSAGHYSIDRSWSENFQPGGRVYACHPPVAVQRNSPSDLCSDPYRQRMRDMTFDQYNKAATERGWKLIEE